MEYNIRIIKNENAIDPKTLYSAFIKREYSDTMFTGQSPNELIGTCFVYLAQNNDKINTVTLDDASKQGSDNMGCNYFIDGELCPFNEHRECHRRPCSVRREHINDS